jgi:hypothetical protein
MHAATRRPPRATRHPPRATPRSRSRARARCNPGPGGTIRRFALAGLLLGPGLGIALGPWLASGRLPLFESRISWQGAAPTIADWPRAPGHGESAITRDIGARTFLIARAPTAAGAEALALELALPRLSRAPELARAAHRPPRRVERSTARRATRDAHAGRGLRRAPCAAGPTHGARWRRIPLRPRLRPCASRARCRKRAAKSRGQRSRRTWQGSIRRSSARRAWRGARLFTRIGALPTPDRVISMDSWRRAWRGRAAEMDSLADALVSRKPRLERELVARAAPAFALDAEARIPDPGVTLLLAAGSEPTAARPVLPVWALFALGGAALAMALATPLARSASRARRARREALMRRWQVAGEAFATVPPLAPGPVAARLQVVSGSRARRVARAARELAARFVAGGERVLVIDAGRNLRLHDFFGAQSRLGFHECMREEAPLLGVVQSGGVPGLYVLANGNPSRLRSWEPLGRLLDHAHAHFTRVLLALDPDVTRSAGGALAGRLMDGWWAAPDVTRERAARRFSARLGVALQAIEPAISEHEPLESMVQGFTRAMTAAAPATAVAAAAVAAAQARAEPQGVPTATRGPEPASLEGLVEEVVGRGDGGIESGDRAARARRAGRGAGARRCAAARGGRRGVRGGTRGGETRRRWRSRPRRRTRSRWTTRPRWRSRRRRRTRPRRRTAPATENAPAPEWIATVEAAAAQHAPEQAARIEETTIEPAEARAAGGRSPSRRGLACRRKCPPQRQARDLDEALEMAEAELFVAQGIVETTENVEAPVLETRGSAAAPAPLAHELDAEPEGAETPEVALELPSEPVPVSEPVSDLAPVSDPAPTFAADEAPGLAPAPALLEATVSEPESVAPHAADAIANAATPAAEEPVVLESDPEVGERLRFLIWMRQLRDKKRSEVSHAG